jgi:antitoxin (DNA-binding transcriptional repressor) of toxin-antitoxin stability system
MEYDESGHSATFITPEDIIVAKLVAHQKTESDKHLKDARGVLVWQWDTLDLKAVRRSARASGVARQFEDLSEAVQQEIKGEQ